MTAEALLYAYCIVGGALLTLVLLGLATALFMPGIDKWSKRFFIASFSVLMLSIVAYFFDLFTYSNPGLAMTERVIAFFETLLPSLLMPLLSAYILHCCGENLRNSTLFISVVSLWTALFILLCITQFTKGIYHFTSDNEFIRGPWYPVLIILIAAPVILNLAGVICRRHKLTRSYYIAFLVYLLPSLAALIIHMFISAFLLIVIAISIGALSMLGIIMANQVGQYLYQQRVISDQRASIAVLQMRPHFICNTMMSIYYLCEQDPQKAQQVTLDFTTYLRKNLSVMTSNDTSLFSDELEHTRAYLAVVQAQHEDSLFVEYDTPHTSFRVPSLTLQPIVENAVKYGMNPDNAEPLHISIKTVKTASGYEIIVEDNGPGFRPADNKEPHIALANIRERLTLTCGGTLEITSCETGGTRVKVFVPYPENVNVRKNTPSPESV